LPSTGCLKKQKQKQTKRKPPFLTELGKE